MNGRPNIVLVHGAWADGSCWRARRGRVARRAPLAGAGDTGARASVHGWTGFGWLSVEDLVEHFATDVDRPRARVMWAVQQALASSAFTDVMGPPAWKSLPTWYLVAQNDEALPPDAERQFAARMGATTVEIPASHVAMVSHPTEVAQLIEQAAQSVGAATAR